MNVKTIANFLIVSAAVAYQSSAYATFINLGPAQNYNVFVEQDFTATSSDVEGRLAAGGDVSIQSYSVNIINDNGNVRQTYQDTSDNPALVAGGDLSFRSGSIAGNVVVEGNYTPVQSGTVSNGSVSIGVSSGIDFVSAFSYFDELSSHLSSLQTNSEVITEWSTQKLVGHGINGSDGDLHVFNLSADDLLYSDYQLSNVDEGDTVILNVSGDEIQTSWGNFAGSDNSIFANSANVLYNFYEASSITLRAAMYGTILAPNADISAPHGVTWGQVIAQSWFGNMQINDNPFDGDLPPPPGNPSSVSEPAYLVGLGLVLIFAMRRLQREGAPRPAAQSLSLTV